MSSIFGNVLDGLKKLMQALQAIEPAPNDTTVYFNDTVLCMNPLQNGVSGVLGADILQLDNNGETLILNSNEIAYTPSGGGTLNAPWADLINAVYPNLQYVLLNGNTSNDEIQLNYILTNTITTYSGTSLVFDPQGGIYNYRIAMDTTFLKLDTGISLRVTNTDTHVLKDYSFQASNGFSFNFDPYTNYLDENGNAGWSTILSNQDSSDITVNADIDFYSHAVGYTGTTMNLKKFATARFTLVPNSSTSSGYAWAVSMY